MPRPVREVPRNVHYRRDNKCWRARYWPNGSTEKPIERSGFARKLDADAWLDSEIGRVSSGTWVNPKLERMTVSEFVASMFWDLNANEDQTIDHQKSLFKNHVEPFWGTHQLDEIQKAAVRAWALTLPKQPKIKGTGPVSLSTARNIYWLFHSIVATAVDYEYLGRSPLPSKSGLPDDQSQPIGVFLQPHQIEQAALSVQELSSVHDPRYFNEVIVPDWPLMNYTFVYSQGYGGFRPGEGSALRVGDLDFATNNVRVDEQYRRGKGGAFQFSPDLKRARSQRTVPVPPEMMELYAEHIDVNIGWDDPDALLFTTPQGQPWAIDNWRKRWWYPALDNTDLPRMRVHDLRHTAASAWFAEKFDIVEVARFLGETLASAEKIYVHLHKGSAHERMARMGQGLARARAERGQAPVIPIRGRGRGA